MLDHESVRVVRNFVQRTSDRINDRYGGLIDRIRRIFVVELAIRVAREMSEDDLTHMAAGVAYYALFSIFPLIIGMITVFSYFLHAEQIQANIANAIGGFLPGSEQFVQDNIEGILNLRSALGLVSLLGLLWSGSAMMGALDRAINRAWDIHKDRPIYVGKPRHFLMVFSAGLLFAISMSSAAVVRTAQEMPNLDYPVIGFVVDNMGWIILQVLSFILMLVIFLMMYKVIPNTKTYWRYIWPGALVAAILFETSKNLFLLYLQSFASYQNVYGSIAPVIVLLFWAYLSSFIVLMGAELCSEYERLKHNVERGVVRADEGEADSAADQSPPVRAEAEDAAG